MVTLTVGELDEGTIRRLCVRATEYGRFVGAEHREILRASLVKAACSRRR